MKSMRAMIAGLTEMGPVTIRGQEYTGAYFSTVVATNPELPEDEANRTPRLVSELGRVVAAALYEKEVAEAHYRAWKADHIHELTNDLEAAENADFKCAVDPGQDSRGNCKPKICPSKTAIEEYLRTLPEYIDRRERLAKLTEAWATVHAAFTAAEARVWAIKAWERTGGTSLRSRAASQAPVEDGANTYHPGYGDTAEEARQQREALEAQAVQGERTPLPPVNGSPPPPPQVEPVAASKKRAPPPPPPRS